MAHSFGWDDNRFMWNKGHFKEVTMVNGKPHGERRNIGDEESYGNDWLADRTIDFIKAAPADQPFASHGQPPDPHQPYRTREPYASMFPEDQVETLSTFAQENVPDFIAVHREEKDFPMQAENRKDWNRDRETTLRRVKSQYMGMVKNIDDCVGKMVAALDEQGVLDNTIVVFTTDHGDLMGEHGMTGKNFLYEPAYRIPFVVRWPEKIPAGHIVDDMVTMIDFAPTILDLAGADHSGAETGVSAAKQLTGTTDESWRNEVFTHPFTERVAYFTPEFEIGFDKQGEPILFDRQNDVDQVNNLYSDPAHAATVTAMTDRMKEHLPSIVHALLIGYLATWALTDSKS